MQISYLLYDGSAYPKLTPPVSSPYPTTFSLSFSLSLSLSLSPISLTAFRALAHCLSLFLFSPFCFFSLSPFVPSLSPKHTLCGRASFPRHAASLRLRCTRFSHPYVSSPYPCACFVYPPQSLVRSHPLPFYLDSFALTLPDSLPTAFPLLQATVHKRTVSHLSRMLLSLFATRVAWILAPARQQRAV